MAEKERPEEPNINTNGGNYNERIEGDYIQGNKIILQGNQLTPQEDRNRQALLTQVNNFWVKGVLEKSLHNQVLIELGLEERPDAITNSWHAILETGENSPQPLPQGTKIIDVFDDIGAGRTLLILGEPGSGKTTTLLELTRDLIARAEQDTKQLIPVVFNLSSWAKKRQKIEDWLIEELGNKYDVLKKIRESLVKEQQLLPLLDGLDEVKAEYRDDCIVAINQFKQDYGAELVVCSRTKDYQGLSQRLKFQSAVCLKLLSQKQIYNYLDSLGKNLTGLKTLIVEDEVWQRLSESPLMLNIMVIAYEGIAIDNLPKTGLLEERRKKLFDNYIEQVFKRRKANQLYTNKQVIHWLVWLAQKMVQESQTVFLIEKMQPSWLENRKQRQAYGTVVGIISGLIQGLIFGPIWGLILGLILGLIFGLNVRLNEEIETIEKLQFQWSFIFAALLISGLMGVFMRVLILDPTWWLMRVPTLDLIGLLMVVLIFASAGFLMGVLLFKLQSFLIGVLNHSEIEIKQIPNQGIWLSARNAITACLMAGFMGVLMGGLTFLFLTGGLIVGLMVGLTKGGLACIQHFILRLILYCNKYIPWNYARFLDYAADRILLQKVGGGYIFIHRMLMEHFAEMPLD